MLVYNLDSLKEQINFEIETLKNQLDFSNIKRKCLISYTLKITDCINDITNLDDTSSLFKFIEELKNTLDLINNNIDTIDLLISDLNNFNELLERNELHKDNLDAYNNKYENFNKQIYLNLSKIEETFENFSKYTFFNFENADFDKIVAIENKEIDKNEDIDSKEVTSAEEKAENNSEEIKENIPEQSSSSSSLTDNKVLLISEKENKVFLPYLVKDLEKKLKASDNKYSSLEELIDAEYIIPLSRFSNAALARFREAFNLMRNKENASILKSLDLAYELCFKQTLNPAVISACKNIDELDIYINCLEENDLESFKIFEIQFDFAPIAK